MEKCKLGDIAKITMGQSPKGNTYNSLKNGMPFLQGNRTFGRLYPQIDTWTTNPIKIGKSESVLMSVRAPVGALNVANQDICIGRGLCSIEMKNGDNKFLYYLLINYMKKIKNVSGGTVFDSINKRELEELEVNKFCNEDMNKIVYILSIIDEKIESNNQINNNLLEIINNIFKNWFVNFEFPNSNGKTIDSEFGEIPENWKYETLGDYITIKNGCAFKGKDFIEKGVPVLKIKNIKPNKVLLNDLSYVSQELAEEKSKYKLNMNDIVITMTGNRIDGTPDSWVGKVALFNDDNTYLLNQRLAVILGDSNYLNQYYLNTLLSSWEYQLYFIQRATSSGGQANVSPDLIKNIQFLLPEKEIMDKFYETVSPMYETISNNEKENKKLEQLRDTLLPKLINGEINLENIKIIN